MQWSVSGSRTFYRCQRQWYYYRILSSPRAKDPLRRRASRLSKLQSISMWRGSLVDEVISKTLIPSLNRKSVAGLNTLKEKAFNIFNRQLEFAKQHKLHDDGISPSTEEYFAAFHCMEYGGKIPENEIEIARNDVEEALTNLYQMSDVLNALKSAQYLIAQRPLSFSHSGVSVKSTPDVIAFYANSPPLIIDWKVHTFGISEAWLQLGIYAIALARCNRHRDFPQNGLKWDEKDVRLLEVQLLTKSVREYSLSEEDSLKLDNYIASSAVPMLYATDGKKYPELVAVDFPVTNNPSNCARCQFKSICWGDEQ